MATVWFVAGIVAIFGWFWLLEYRHTRRRDR